MDPVPLLMPVIYAIIPIPLIFTPSSLPYLCIIHIPSISIIYMFMISYIIIYHIPIFHHLPPCQKNVPRSTQVSAGRKAPPQRAAPTAAARRRSGAARAARRRRRRASARAARAPPRCAPGPPSTSLAPWGLEPRGLGHWDGAWVHGVLMESDLRLPKPKLWDGYTIN